MNILPGLCMSRVQLITCHAMPCLYQLYVYILHKWKESVWDAGTASSQVAFPPGEQYYENTVSRLSHTHSKTLLIPVLTYMEYNVDRDKCEAYVGECMWILNFGEDWKCNTLS